MADDLPFRISTVHVTDLLVAVNRYHQAVGRAVAQRRPELAMEALKTLEKFCDDHALPVSFASRQIQGDPT